MMNIRSEQKILIANCDAERVKLNKELDDLRIFSNTMLVNLKHKYRTERKNLLAVYNSKKENINESLEENQTKLLNLLKSVEKENKEIIDVYTLNKLLETIEVNTNTLNTEPINRLFNKEEIRNFVDELEEISGDLTEENEDDVFADLMNDLSESID